MKTELAVIFTLAVVGYGLAAEAQQDQRQEKLSVVTQAGRPAGTAAAGSLMGWSVARQHNQSDQQQAIGLSRMK